MLAGCGATSTETAGTEVTSETVSESILEQPSTLEQASTIEQASAQEQTTEQESASETETAQQSEIVITTESFEGASDENDTTVKYTYEYEVPTITIPSNEAAQSAIQADLDQRVNTFLESVNGGEFGLRYDETDEHESFQSMSVQVMRADEQVISVEFSIEGYDGGAHGWHNVEYYNYFTETGERITFDALGEGFRERAEQLVSDMAARTQEQSEDGMFFEEYEASIPFVVIDGTEDSNEVNARVYDWWEDSEPYVMTPTFYITDTGFCFVSGQYVLQPYAGGILLFEFTAADFGDAYTADIFTDEGALVTSEDSVARHY